jgi:dihydrofolate reductase
MGRLVVGTMTSLDGVVQGPGGPDEDRDGGFDLGGWVFPHVDESVARVIDPPYLGASGFVLGRRSYDLLAAHWPLVTDPDDALAAKLNAAPKYLVSRTRSTGDWSPTTVVPDLAALADAVSATDGYLQVIGSAALVRSLLAEGMVDEILLWTFPVLLGAGKRVFADGARPAGMELADVVTTPNGVVVSRYRVAGEPRVGSFALDAGEG